MEQLKTEIRNNKELPLSLKLMRIETVSKGYIETLLSTSNVQIEDITEYNCIRAAYKPCYKPISNPINFIKLR